MAAGRSAVKPARELTARMYCSRASSNAVCAVPQSCQSPASLPHSEVRAVLGHLAGAGQAGRLLAKQCPPAGRRRQAQAGMARGSTQQMPSLQRAALTGVLQMDLLWRITSSRLSSWTTRLDSEPTCQPVALHAVAVASSCSGRVQAGRLHTASQPSPRGAPFPRTHTAEAAQLRCCLCWGGKLTGRQGAVHGRQ